MSQDDAKIPGWKYGIYVTWPVLIQSLLDRHLSVIRDYIFKDEGDGST